MKSLYKILFLLIFTLNFNQFTYAKPLPPGSGEGDVRANILILLDSSASMDNNIGDGLPNITSVTINPDTGERYLTAASRRGGGLYLIDAAGERANMTGLRDNGSSYEVRKWVAGANTDRSCDWSINRNNRVGMNTNISTNRSYHGVRYLRNVTVGRTNINGENLLFVGQYQQNNNMTAVFALDENFRCRLALVPGGSRRGFQIRGFDISQNAAGQTIVAVYGRDRRNGFIFSCNLAAGECARSAGGAQRGNIWDRLRDGSRLRLNSDSTMMYISDDGDVHGYTTEARGNTRVVSNRSQRTRFCDGIVRRVGTQVTFTTVFDLVNDDEMVVGGNRERIIQRVSWQNDGSCFATVFAGTASTLANVDDNGDAIAAGDLAAVDIRLVQALGGLNISNNRIIFTHDGFVDELLTNGFVQGTQDTAWQVQYGGQQFSRLEGAKRAIIAILSDNTLTSGANFGFGHWNAGERNFGTGVRPDRGRPRGRGGSWCHNNNNPCNYYGGWTGTRSRICTTNSCLNVGVGPEGAALAIPEVRRIRTAFGTDAEAFSQIAHDYFTGGEGISPHDPNSDCQLNYVIVIGDGMQKKTGLPSSRNRGRTAARLEALRNMSPPVKTLFVAYGDGINPAGMQSFDELAVVGSCAAAGQQECEPTIIARTPEELTTQLQQKIRQILAERLSFTAPSITATIEKGGSLYQAQFSYEQFGEWQGTILRKHLNADGTVEHEIDYPGNWDASIQVRNQSSSSAGNYSTDDSRNLWTVISDVEGGGYIGNWDNLNDDNALLLEPDMEMLGFQVTNYHTSTSRCGGDDTTDDEVKGLFRFLAGQDFFDYDGDCTTGANDTGTTELRDHVLGDIYHSQLIEVGAPDGNVEFSSNNEEAYFRSINNYQAFKTAQQNRRNVIYAGSNSGLIHAFNAETGDEEWAFLPPILIGKLPNIINESLNGSVDGSKGGSNAIFGVDGSPVVHDVFIKGLTPLGTIEESPSWHTILFVPFGRGGSGFTVLDVTNPIVEPAAGPLHMFTVYNDYINNVVHIADHDGDLTSYEYASGQASLTQSEEGQIALNNYNQARQDDGEDTLWTQDTIDDAIADGEFTVDTAPQVGDIQIPAPTTNRDNRSSCQGPDPADGNIDNFIVDGTNSCYTGRTYTFRDIQLNTPEGQDVDRTLLNVTELVDGTFEKIDFTSARMQNNELVITFDTNKTIDRGDSTTVDAAGNVTTSQSDNIFIQTSCTATTIADAQYDYSKLGETWSTPRIVRLPSDIAGEQDEPLNDKYVAIMGGGMSTANACTGSALFLVDLSDTANPGRLYGSSTNGGPITIVDTHPTGFAFGNSGITTANGSEINNAVPTTPVVITPDTAFGIPWRGAMVYINDREGKITKINLTDSTANGAVLFNQKTLFRLNANTTNRRYSFFGMDAGIGNTTKDFWLFGGTGDFNALGDKTIGMDNILYGIRDREYPFFVPSQVPLQSSDIFVSAAHADADAAKSIDDATHCSDVSLDDTGDACPDAEDAWVYHLDPITLPTTNLGTTAGTQDQDTVPNSGFRKASAPPTLFKGQVYFPVYEPPAGQNVCNIGNAFICVHDDECGTDNSHKLVKGREASVQTCTFVREGVLSELVIFGDKLFANVAGPSENAETLYSILSVPGEILSNKGGWRDTGF